MQKTELRGWKRLKSFVLTLSAFFILNSTFVNSSFAQTYPVQVTPVISGPNLPYLSYYGDQNQHLNLFVLLTDFTAPSQNVRLKLSFTGPNLRFETNPFAINLPIYTLNPGEPLLITGSDLLPYLLEQNLLQTEGNAVDLDKLPEGFYTLCVDVIKNDVNAEILSTNNCRSFYIQEIQPPLLNLPMKFSQVDTTEQIISFLWTQPLNYAPNPSVEIRYHFKLYEWIDTTNFNIFATGQGLVYEEETNLNIQVINTAFDVYLRSGYKYIWQVQAKAYDANTGAFLDLITQNGVSAPFWFNYGEKQSLQATLTNGLTLDLSAQAQNTRKGMAFWTITDETPGEGLSDYEAYIIEYRKFDSTGVNPYDWHSDTLQNKNFDIYQLEPAQAYEVRVSALVGDYRTPILDTARFVTPPQVDYACNSETQPFSQTNYTPLQTAYAGMVFQLGQFELTVSEITALQQVGHYTGKGTIKHDFLGGAKCNVTFEDLLVDQEFVVREGEAQAVTDGAENWTNQHYLDMVTPYPAGGVIESYGFLNDSTVFVVVNGVQQTYTFPENGNLPIVVQGANNVEIQFWPDGTIVVTTYGTTPSADHLDATADRFAEFEAISGQEKFFDKKQYDHFASNYELISCENNFNYFVSNTAKGTVGTTQVKAVYHVRTPGYSASGVSFKLGGGYTTVTHTQENDTTFVLTLPERSFSYDVYAYYGEFKIGKLRVVSLQQKERKVRIVPLVALSQSESAIEQAVNSIYAPANVTLDVKIDSVFSTADFNAQTVFSDPEVDGMQKYTAQMRALRDAYKETHELASNEYLLFVIPGFETAAIDGYMVRGKGLGFVKINSNLAEFVHTMAHELGHGMGGLTHSWGEDVSKKGLTTNLLDYSTDTKLIKGQWEDLNEAPNVVSLWDGEEDGELTLTNYDIESLVKFKNQNNSLTFLTPSGSIISIPIDEKLSEISISDFNIYKRHDATQSFELPYGTLDGFTYNNVEYNSYSLSGSNIQFTGYKNSNNQNYIDSLSKNVTTEDRKIIFFHSYAPKACLGSLSLYLNSNNFTIDIEVYCIKIASSFGNFLTENVSHGNYSTPQIFDAENATLGSILNSSPSIIHEHFAERRYEYLKDDTRKFLQDNSSKDLGISSTKVLQLAAYIENDERNSYQNLVDCGKIHRVYLPEFHNCIYPLAPQGSFGPNHYESLLDAIFKIRQYFQQTTNFNTEIANWPLNNPSGLSTRLNEFLCKPQAYEALNAEARVRILEVFGQSSNYITDCWISESQFCEEGQICLVLETASNSDYKAILDKLEENTFRLFHRFYEDVDNHGPGQYNFDRFINAISVIAIEEKLTDFYSSSFNQSSLLPNFFVFKQNVESSNTSIGNHIDKKFEFTLVPNDSISIRLINVSAGFGNQGIDRKENFSPFELVAIYAIDEYNRDGWKFERESFTLLPAFMFAAIPDAQRCKEIASTVKLGVGVVTICVSLGAAGVAEGALAVSANLFDAVAATVITLESEGNLSHRLKNEYGVNSWQYELFSTSVTLSQMYGLTRLGYFSFTGLKNIATKFSEFTPTQIEFFKTYSAQFYAKIKFLYTEIERILKKLVGVNGAVNLLSNEVLLSYEFYGIRAVRVKQGTNGKIAIIGQSMGDFPKRGEYGVVDYARELRTRGYETELFAGPRITNEARTELDNLKAALGRNLTPSELETTIAYKENMAWAKWVKEEGFTVIDIGNPNNKPYSHFYNGECTNIFGN